MRLFAKIACLAVAASSAAAAAQEPRGSPEVAVPAASAPVSPDPAPPVAVAPAPIGSAAAPPAQAKPPAYLVVRGGMFQPQGDGDLLAFFDDGMALELAVGVPLNRHVAFEAGVGYYASGTGRITETDPVGGTLSAKLDLSVIPITGSVRVGTRLERLSLSALVGVGIHMATLEADVSTPWISGSISDDDNRFGLHLGGGLAFDVTPRVSVGAEIRRTFVTATLMDEDFELDGLHIGATLALRL